jgi:Domain of unknown function (DUF4333)
MSTPQNPPYPGAGDQPFNQQGWGQPTPPGGWGPPAGQDYDDGGPTRAFGQPGGAPGWGQQQGWQQPTQQPTQQQWGHQQGQQGWHQPTQQQWGPQQGQQWGQGYPGEQPPPGAKKKSALPWIIVAVVVVVLGVVAVLGFVAPGFFLTKVFDSASVQQGVTQVLNGYGIGSVSAVSCPTDVKVVAGQQFQCTATIDGEQKTVPVRIVDGEGGYEVGLPA